MIQLNVRAAYLGRFARSVGHTLNGSVTKAEDSSTWCVIIGIHDCDY